MVQKIVPLLWFNKEAKEAATLYTSLFSNFHIAPNQSRVTHTSVAAGSFVRALFEQRG